MASDVETLPYPTPRQIPTSDSVRIQPVTQEEAVVGVSVSSAALDMRADGTDRQG